jgi:hypothetical protein
VIAEDYDTKLKNLESEERAFKNSISWKGKIDTYNRTNAKILAGFEDRKTALHQEKNKEVGTHKADIEGKGFSTAIFSLLMEIIAIACMVYVCYVNFYVFVESKTVSPTDSESEAPTKIGFSQVPNSTIAPQVNKVGFQLGTTLKVNNGEGNTVKVEKEYIQLQANERICKHCNSKFTFKHWNATYCGEKCKIDAWEKRTGKKFNKKKGGTSK